MREQLREQQKRAKGKRQHLWPGKTERRHQLLISVDVAPIAVLLVHEEIQFGCWCICVCVCASGDTTKCDLAFSFAFSFEMKMGFILKGAAAVAAVAAVAGQQPH